MIKQRHIRYCVPNFNSNVVISGTTIIQRAAILKMADISCLPLMNSGKQVNSCS